MVGEVLVVPGLWWSFNCEMFTLVNWDGIQVERDVLTWINFGEKNENIKRIMEFFLKVSDCLERENDTLGQITTNLMQTVCQKSFSGALRRFLFPANRVTELKIRYEI